MYGAPLTSCVYPSAELPAGIDFKLCRTFRFGHRTVVVLGIPEAPTDRLLAALQSAVAGVGRRPDLVVALSAISLEQERELLSHKGVHALLDVVIGMRGSPQRQPYTSNRVTLLPLPTKGEIGVLDVNFSEQPPRILHRFDEVSDEEPGEKAVEEVVTEYFIRQARQLREASQSPKVDWRQLNYEPANRCGTRHPTETRAWQSSSHSLASRTLQAKERLVPECLSCHSEMFRRTGKFNDTLSMAWHGVSCTSCHGDGVVHTATRTRDSITRSMGELACRGCHDTTNDPNFDYASYLAKIKHW